MTTEILIADSRVRDNTGSRMRALTPRQMRMLEVVGRLALATSEQVNQALYSKGCFHTTRADLSSLCAQDFLNRCYFHTSVRGSPKYVYKLSMRGHRALGIPGIIRPSDNLNETTIQLQHSVEANQTLVMGGYELIRHYPHLQAEFLSEVALRHQHFKAVHARKIDATVPMVPKIPDAWLSLRKEPTGHFAWAFELERKNNDERFREKILAYLDIDQSDDYEAVFGTRNLLVVILCSDPKRRTKLMAMTKRALEDVRRTYQSDLFLFGTVAPTADEFFFSPRFLTLEGELVSLLPTEWKNQ